ncbi:E3 ubiquitin/ISG15 ligase TRIM25-like [Chiloscyllium plagiosum]|uniref:E3 ubiquitin/ISG15 ligase TRIM25-like n=1 Tax=Chiloscyllium plagiosum TaxID=36176 RepID=UPI001CB82DD0|nr:E3 ubiquitin/ISG15 ligase TRIM25-like [Chiloscyllium plagiosum]
MATASSQSWLDEELTCSICLQVYTDPVTLACQHSYCRACIEECSPQSCPECRAEVPGFRRLRLAKGAGDYLAVAPAAAAASAAAAPNSVLCSYCSRSRRQAVKTCLKCEASMCPIHLKLHTANGVFQTHPLVDTAADLSVWRCAEHEKLLDIYCKEDKVCVCTLCTLIGKHKGHNFGSISEGEQELRDNLEHHLTSIRRNVASIQSSLQDLHTQKLTTQSLITETKREVKEKYDALRKHIENEERDVFHCLDKEQSRVTAAIDSHIRKLEKEIKFFEMCLVNLTDLSQKREKLAFIQGFNTMVTRIKNASEQLTSSQPGPCLDKIKLDRIKNHTQKNLELVSQVKRDRDRLISLYGQRLTPDLNTAHAQFILSDGNRILTLSPKRQSLPKNAERFDCCQQLLCAEGVKAGRSYWEVEVLGDSGVWKIGLCYRSISRKGKGTECLLGRNRNSWCLYSLVGSVLALHDDNDTKLTVGNISRVGVYVDFEAGTILFYSVCDRKLTLVHTFQEQTFTEALYPALQIGDFTTSLSLCTLK